MEGLKWAILFLCLCILYMVVFLERGTELNSLRADIESIKRAERPVLILNNYNGSTVDIFTTKEDLIISEGTK